MKFRDLPESNGARNFLKLKDQEVAEGVFLGDLHEFSVLWENGKSRIVPDGTPRASFRFRVNFVMKEGPVFVAKIFEQGAVVYKQLAELHEEYDLSTTIVKIKRNGVGVDTSYSVLPMVKKPLTPETMAHLKTIQLNDLSTDSAPKGVDSSEEIPF
jgi:hypothetical protein